MTYEVSLTPAAVKYLGKMQKKIARQLVRRLEGLADDPQPRGCVKLKTDKERYRIRSGDYRIIYEIRDKVLLVLVIRIDHRQSIYDKFKRSND